jgi:hypothetical protein
MEIKMKKLVIAAQTSGFYVTYQSRREDWAWTETA